MTATIDKAGRIVVPKAIRDDLHLRPGDEFDIRVTGRAFTFAPKPILAKWITRSGVLVRSTGTPATYDPAAEIAKSREERIQQVIAHSNTGPEGLG